MAIPCQGITITWGGTAFSEVVSFAYTYGGNSIGRERAEVGTASIACLGTANTSITHHGERRQLVATGGGHNLTIDAIWQSVDASATRNDVTSFAITFRLVED